MLGARIQQVISFFRRQSNNFKVLLVHRVIVGGGMRVGAIHTLTRQYTNLYIVALGASKVELGLVSSIGTTIRTILDYPIGWVIDKVSLKKMMLLGLMFSVLSSLIYALAVNWYMVIPATLLLSLAWPMSGVVSRILLTDSLSDTDRGTGFGILEAVGAIPGVVMPFVAAYLVETLGGINPEGIRPLFYFEAISLIPVSLWIYWRLRDPDRSVGGMSTQTLGFLGGIKKFVVEEKGARNWMLVGIFDAFGMLAFPYLYVYAVEAKGASPVILGFMTAASALATIGFSIPWGRLADRIGRKKVLYLGLIPNWAWIFLLLLAPSPEWLILVGIFEGAFSSTFMLWGAVTMELIPPQWRGSYSGISSMVRGIASALAMPLGGLLWETVGSHATFLLALGLETVSIALVTTIPETLASRRPRNQLTLKGM